MIKDLLIIIIGTFFLIGLLVWQYEPPKTEGYVLEEPIKLGIELPTIDEVILPTVEKVIDKKWKEKLKDKKQKCGEIRLYDVRSIEDSLLEWVNKEEC